VPGFQSTAFASCCLGMAFLPSASWHSGYMTSSWHHALALVFARVAFFATCRGKQGKKGGHVSTRASPEGRARLLRAHTPDMHDTVPAPVQVACLRMKSSHCRPRTDLSEHKVLPLQRGQPLLELPVPRLQRRQPRLQLPQVLLLARSRACWADTRLRSNLDKQRGTREEERKERPGVSLAQETSMSPEVGTSTALKHTDRGVTPSQAVSKRPQDSLCAHTSSFSYARDQHPCSSCVRPSTLILPSHPSPAPLPLAATPLAACLRNQASHSPRPLPIPLVIILIVVPSSPSSSSSSSLSPVSPSAVEVFPSLFSLWSACFRLCQPASLG